MRFDFARRVFGTQVNEQAGLILLPALPSLALALWALHAANFSPYLIGFFALVLGLLLTYSLVTSGQRAQYQIQTLSNLVEALIEGDYSLRGREAQQPAFAELLNRINQLADQLAEHKLRAEERQLLLDKILQQMDALVIATAEGGRIALLNRRAEDLLLDPTITSAATTLADLDLAALASANVSGIIKLQSNRLSGEFFLYKDRFMSEGVRHELYLLTRADRLLREKEREAWQSLLRVLGHELNNTLTPITSISRAMLRELEAGHVDPTELGEGLRVIRERGESLGNFVQAYARLTQLPSPIKRPFVLQARLHQLIALFPQRRIELSGDPKQVAFADPQQFDQALINLLKNADQAMQSSPEAPIELRWMVLGTLLELQIEDQGEGIANPANLFVPLYSTKPGGQGIGLALSRQILLNHDGQLTLENRVDGSGAIARLCLPLREPADQSQ